MNVIVETWLGALLVKIGAAVELKDAPKEEPKPIPTVPPRSEPVNTGDTTKPDFAYLWATCEIRPEKMAEVNSVCKRLFSNKSRYDEVSKATGVPWDVIACIHELESGASFQHHLHCGDPLTARTVHVPAGRPIKGNPPFTWFESAVDALGYDGASGIKDWNIVATLAFLHAYNGTGYTRKGVYSPYLWSYTNHYTKGRYVADGKYDPESISQQVGAACILKVLRK